MTTYPARHISIAIDRPFADVHDFVSRPQNFPQWAAGLAEGLTRDGDEWVTAGGPLDAARVRFAPRNDYGVVDHDVHLPNGLTVHNPLRVTPNGDGAEVTFTLFRLPHLAADADFERDAAAVTKDLQTLKALLEGK
jgi:hypothetical protein